MAKYLEYVEKQLDKVHSIQKNYDDKISYLKQSLDKLSEYGGGEDFSMLPKALQDAMIKKQQEIKALQDECNAEIQKVVDETESFFTSEKKKVIQEIAKVEPIPTEDDRNRAELLKDEYPVIDCEQFRADMMVHIDNETVFAFPYLILARKHFAKSNDNDAFIESAYLKMFPKGKEEKDKLPDIEQGLKVFRTYIIAFRYPTLTDVTDSDAAFERIRMKQELQKMGTLADAIQVNPAIGF